MAHSQACLSCSVTQLEGLRSPGAGCLTEYCMGSKRCFQAEASYRIEVDEILVGLSSFVRWLIRVVLYMVMKTYLGLSVPYYDHGYSSASLMPLAFFFFFGLPFLCLQTA